MRITNKIIQNNSLNNINNNKKLQDMLSTQAATSKKIARPSDDPIIALRSLRLRTGVNQTDQYLNKNVEDADSWLTVTEDAIDTLSEIITDIKKQYVKGTSDQLAVSDRRIIVENLQSLAAEIYNTGNADFAGRSVFTGYRTESTLTFQEQEDVDYRITQTMLRDDINEWTCVTGKTATTEAEVEKLTAYRIRLPYDNCKNDTVTLDYYDSDGVLKGTVTVNTVPYSEDTYETVITNVPDGKATYIPETGEIFLANNSREALMGVASFQVTYGKSAWNKGDLRPEHYFECIDNTNNVEYNVGSSPEGEICYNIGVNQSIRINTTASECFTHDIMRDVTDVLRCIKDVENIESRLAQLKARYAATDANNASVLNVVQKEIDAAEKAQTFLKDKMHKMFSSCIDFADMYLDRNNVALTNCGTRSKRLELIRNRLDTQFSTLKELKSDNEDADLAETAIKLSSAQYAYDASLMATGQIIQKSLLDYV